METEVFWAGARLFVAGVVVGGVGVSLVVVLCATLLPLPQPDQDQFDAMFTRFVDGESDKDDPDTITLELVGGPADGKTLNVDKNVGLLSFPHPTDSGEWEQHEYRRCWDKDNLREVLVHSPLVRD